MDSWAIVVLAFGCTFAAIGFINLLAWITEKLNKENKD